MLLPKCDDLATIPLNSARALWVARLERWTDRPLTLLAVLLVPILLAPFVLELSAEAETALHDVSYGIWGVFVASLSAALIMSPDRRGYLRRHWLDLLVVAVPIFAPLRSARVIQVIWAVSAAGRMLEGGRRLLIGKGTGFLLIGASLVVAVAAGLIVSVERDDPASTIHSYGDGLWWAMTTFATVGYGDKYPVTASGRGIAIALMLLGITAFGVVTARLAALFVEEQEDKTKLHLEQMDERMRRIERALLRTPSDQAQLPALRRRIRKPANANSTTRARKRSKRRLNRGAEEEAAS